MTVQFDATQSFDPEYNQLTYNWNFGDGTTSNEITPNHVFQTNSGMPTTFSAQLTVTDNLGAFSQQKIPISLNNTPPVIVSTSIDAINSFNAKNGTTLNLNAIITDTEHNGQLKYEWQTALFHNGHNHAEPIDNNPSTVTTLPPIECDGSTYWFRITLKVTDPEGLSAFFQKDIFPDCVGLAQTINMSIIPDQSITTGSFIIAVSATSGLPVSTYLLEGPAIIYGNKIVLTGFPGKITIRNTQGGNDIFKPAIPIEQSFDAVLPSNASCLAEGRITRDIWAGTAYNSINDIPVSSPPNQSRLLDNFEVKDFFSKDDAQRIRGFICPPQTGLYSFWIASEEDSQLWLSTNSNAKNKRLIANIKGTTKANQWNKFSSQQSEPILLVAGSQYYMEALMNGGGHLSAGWKMPDNTLNRPISGQHLSPWEGKQEQTITFFGVSDKITTDAAFTIGATASSGLPVEFSVTSGPATVSGSTVTLTGGIGTVIIQAKQRGNNQYHSAKNVERRFVVTTLPPVPAISINAPSNEEALSKTTVNIRYSLSGDLQFYKADHLLISLDNQTPIDVHTLNGQYTLDNVSTGKHTLKMQIANSNHQPFTNSAATDIINFSITPIIIKNQSITFPSISNKFTSDAPFEVIASASSGLPVTFVIESGPANINGKIITLQGTPGTVIIRASQNGNEEYKRAISFGRSFIVSESQKLNQLISFSSISDKLSTDRAFTIRATASSGLPVSFSILSGPASINGNLITLNGNSGTVVVRAKQDGNGQYFSAPRVDRPFTVNSPVVEIEPNNEEEEEKEYCTLKSDFPWQEWIGQVVFGEVNNTSEKEIYHHYSNQQSIFHKGKEYLLKIIPAFSWMQWDEYIKVWIDFNKDGDFKDSGEEVLAAINFGKEAQSSVEGVSGTIKIPTNALEGISRMRVTMQRDNYVSSCGVIIQGEVEDYTIIIGSEIAPEVAIEKQNQSIDFPPISDQLSTNIPFAINATTTSNLPITFNILSGPATIDGNIITLNGSEGTVVVNAIQSGNSQFNAAQSINRAFKVVVLTNGGEEIEEPSNKDYCTSKATAPWQEWIGNVSFGTIDNNSFKEGFGDFTNLITTANKGASYSISVSPEFSWTQWNEHIIVWIDFNQNGRFDDIGEQVLSGISMAGAAQSIPQSVSGTVSIPVNAKEGTTRMRVVMKQSEFSDVCGDFEFGEVEDYSVNIIASASNRLAQILSFSAYSHQNQMVELEWLTNGDWQANNYQIERSGDNLKFYAIQEMAVKRINTEANYYYSADESPLKGISYYRIKQINKDGSFKYSNSEQIQRTFGVDEFYLFPNPVKEIIHVNLKPFLGKSAYIKIYNPFGQLVKESVIDKVQNSLISFRLNEEQNGIYYLSIKATGMRVIGKKFVLSRNY